MTALEAIHELQIKNEAFAHMISRLGADNYQLTRQVTDVQTRCTSLLEERRSLMARVAELESQLKAAVG